MSDRSDDAAPVAGRRLPGLTGRLGEPPASKRARAGNSLLAPPAETRRAEFDALRSSLDDLELMREKFIDDGETAYGPLDSLGAKAIELCNRITGRYTTNRFIEARLAERKKEKYKANKMPLTDTVDTANDSRIEMYDQEQPPTNDNPELTAIQERGSELAQAVRTIGGLGLEGVEIQVQIAGLHEIASRCEHLARTVGMQAIGEGRLSQVQLARLLGIAPLTVNRWVKAAQEHPPVNEQHQDQ